MEALKTAQEQLDAARVKKADLDAEFGAEEAKLLNALKKAEADTAPVAGKQGAQPSQATTQGELTSAELLDRVVALAGTEEGRAAMAERGMVVAPPSVQAQQQQQHQQQQTGEGKDDVPLTQKGTQDPSEKDLEMLVATLPAHLHARLAKRLAQPGVQPSQAQSTSAAEIQRDADAAKEAVANAADSRREGRSPSRSPRREKDDL